LPQEIRIFKQVQQILKFCILHPNKELVLNQTHTHTQKIIFKKSKFNTILSVLNLVFQDGRWSEHDVVGIIIEIIVMYPIQD
jgi:hypothetical protein